MARLGEAGQRSLFVDSRLKTVGARRKAPSNAAMATPVQVVRVCSRCGGGEADATRGACLWCWDTGMSITTDIR